MRPNSIAYPFDQDYTSQSLENGIQLTTIPMALGDLYVLSTAAGFILVQDSATGPVPPPSQHRSRIYPIAAGGYIDRSWHGGANMRYGVYIGAYSTVALALVADAPDLGNVLLIEAYWRRGNYPNPV